jgi:hypothetical protein
MENKHTTEVVKFAKHITPLPVEIHQNKTSEKIVLYGANNLYPDFLLKLYENSPMHNGIINDKLCYILGDGIVEKATGNKYNPMVNANDNLEEFINKIALDYIIFNSFAVEVMYNALGDPIEFVHVPNNEVRSNRSLEMFQICDNWFANSRNVLSYDRWKRGKNDTGKSTLFYYKKYSPSSEKVYPKPEYHAAIKSLETDLAIRDFHLNNITNGFSVSSLITFYGSTLPPEMKAEFQKKIENAYSGAAGAKFIIDFQSKEGKPAEVTNISANDWDKAYDVVRKCVNEDILAAHTMPAILYGQSQEGKMGGSGVEYETAYEKFKILYVKGKRNEIESALNKLFADANYPILEFKDKSTLFSNRISDTTKEKVLTIDELRAIDGLEPLPNGAGAKLIAETVKPAEPARFSLEQPKKEENIYYSLTADDFEKVKDLGFAKADYDLIEKSEAIESFSQLNSIINQFDDNDAINNYLIENDMQGKSVSAIRTEIKNELGISITVADLGDKLAKLKASGIVDIKITDGKITQTPVEQPKPDKAKPSTPKREVEVLYSYEGIKDDRNRAFCAKILETDRFYSREEIQSMTSIFGYDIFKFRGGWYHNPSTNKDTPFCRHHWHANKVIRKGEGK